MTTEPERAQVLKMIEAGQITADDGLRLLQATRRPAGPFDASGRWLRLRITDLTSQRPKVNLNLPLAWVALGMKIGARYSPELAQIDLNEIMAEIQRGAEGRLVDIEDVEDGERIEVYVE